MRPRLGNLLFVLGLAVSYYFGYLRGAGVITEEQLRALLVMIATFLLIATEYRHKVVAALAGVTALWLLGILSGEDMIHFLDMEVIGLLFGMMVVVSALKVGGFFGKITSYLSGLGLTGMQFFFVMTSLTAVLSAFLDNITVSLFMITVGIVLSRSMGINPVPITVATASAAVVGGMGTLVGDPPNIMIAAATGITFNEFLVHMGPIAVLAYAVVILTILLIYRKHFISERREGVEIEGQLTDRWITAVGLISFAGAVALFVLQDVTGISPATAALYAAVITMIFSGDRINDILKDVEWDVLIFLGSLLVLAGGLEKTGVLHLIADAMVRSIGPNEPVMVTVLLWISAVLSSVVDNIPVTASLIPVVAEIVEEIGAPHLWWTLAAGAGIGGIATPLASVPMLIAYRTLEQEGHKMSFWEFTKIGLILLAVTTLAFNVYLLLRY